MPGHGREHVLRSHEFSVIERRDRTLELGRAIPHVVVGDDDPFMCREVDPGQHASHFGVESADGDVGRYVKTERRPLGVRAIEQFLVGPVHDDELALVSDITEVRREFINAQVA